MCQGKELKAVLHLQIGCKLLPPYMLCSYLLETCWRYVMSNHFVGHFQLRMKLNEFWWETWKVKVELLAATVVLNRKCFHKRFHKTLSIQKTLFSSLCQVFWIDFANRQIFFIRRLHYPKLRNLYDCWHRILQKQKKMIKSVINAIEMIARLTDFLASSDVFKNPK